MQHPAPIVAGIYPKKNDNIEFPAAVRMLPDGRSLQEKDGLLVADLIPTGFLRVKRHVYEEMAKESPRYKDGTSGGEECWNFFEMGFYKEQQDDGTDGQWWGEDYAWGRRAHWAPAGEMVGPLFRQTDEVTHVLDSGSTSCHSCRGRCVHFQNDRRNFAVVFLSI